MSVGQATQETNCNKAPSETLIDLQKALELMGVVQSVDQTTFTLHGKTQYGLQTVKIKAIVTGNETVSKIEIVALSDDIGGVGAKNAIQRLLEALQNVDNTNYKPSKTGISSGNLLLRLILFIVILVVVLGAWFTGFVPLWAKVIIIVLGAGLFVYFLVAQAKFSKK